jgi:hypothetical protein
MTSIGFMRTWADDAALAVTRVDEAHGALDGLARDAGRLDETVHVLSDGASFDDPAEAALHLAEDGNRGIWDAWTKLGAAQSLLDRAIGAHPPEGVRNALVAARTTSARAAGDVENWMREAPSAASLQALNVRLDPALNAAARNVERVVERSAG